MKDTGILVLKRSLHSKTTLMYCTHS